MNKCHDAPTDDLTRRFDKGPQPMSYQPAFLDRVWQEYLTLFQQTEAQVDPDDFIRWAYAQALAHRQPRYEAMARNWGITVTADEIAKIKTVDDFNTLIASALERD